MSKRRSTPFTPRAATRREMIQKVIETPGSVALIDVEAVYYSDEPNEAYLEPETMKFLTEARRRARAGDRAWLKKHGARLFVSSPAA